MRTCSLRFQLGMSPASSMLRSPIPARSQVLGATCHRSVSQSTAAGHRRRSACRAAFQQDGRDTGTLSVTHMVQKCLSAVSVSLALAPAGLAEELVPYDGSGGQDLAKNVAGAAYIVFVIFVVVRRFMNRAKRATTERLGSSGAAAKMEKEEEEEWEEPERSSNATPARAAIAALQAAAIGYALFLAATYIDTLMLSQPLPEAYSVRNVALTVRTIIRGTVYLATFVFAANSLGLAGLAIQLLLFPDADSGRAKPTEKSEKSRLPDISLTSSPDEVRRAFDEASKGRMPSSTTKD